jgi:hypothetical protein
VSELEKVDQYFHVEMWKYESGKLGWSLKSANGESVDRAEASYLALEMAEWLMSSDGSEIIASVFLESNGVVHVRRAPGLDITRRDSYVWLKRRLRASVLRFCDTFAPPGRFYDWWSSVEWLWYKVTGRMQRSQTLPAAAATPVASAPPEKLSEASEGLVTGSAQAGGNVLAFRRTPRPKEPSL